jgi:hypothetical protein
LIALTILLALFQAGAALRALQTPLEIAAQVSLPLALEAVLSALWAAAFGVMTVRLWKHKPGTNERAVWLIGGFIGYSVLRLALFARADYDRQRLPFLLMATFFGLIGMVLARFAVRLTNEAQRMLGRRLGNLPSKFGLAIPHARGRSKSTEKMEHGRESQN